MTLRNLVKTCILCRLGARYERVFRHLHHPNPWWWTPGHLQDSSASALRRGFWLERRRGRLPPTTPPNCASIPPLGGANDRGRWGALSIPSLLWLRLTTTRYRASSYAVWFIEPLTKVWPKQAFLATFGHSALVCWAMKSKSLHFFLKCLWPRICNENAKNEMSFGIHGTIINTNLWSLGLKHPWVFWSIEVFHAWVFRKFWSLEYRNF